MMKILAGFIMDGHAGGIDKYLLSFADSVRSEQVKIDFLTNKKNRDLEKYLEKKGSKLYEVANLKNPLVQYKQIFMLLKKNNYDVAYFNISTAISFIGIYAAYKANVAKRIIHSHSSGNDCENFFERKMLNSIHKICRMFLYKYANEYYGCSKAAGYWLFPAKIVNSNSFKMIYNAVDLNKFRFDEEMRKQMREQYKVNECLVIGHAGNFVYQKNHSYIIKIFAKIARQDSSARLLLIGDGKLNGEIKKKVERLGLEEKVMFLGKRSDVAQLYQMMDIFILPSHFEGLPIVGVEAQATGLKCLFSNKITEEVRLTKEARFLPIKKNAVDQWVECIENEKNYNRRENVLLEEGSLYDLKKQEENYKAIIQE